MRFLRSCFCQGRWAENPIRPEVGCNSFFLYWVWGALQKLLEIFLHPPEPSTVTVKQITVTQPWELHCCPPPSPATTYSGSWISGEFGNPLAAWNQSLHFTSENCFCICLDSWPEPKHQLTWEHILPLLCARTHTEGSNSHPYCQISWLRIRPSPRDPHPTGGWFPLLALVPIPSGPGATLCAQFSFLCRPGT